MMQDTGNKYMLHLRIAEKGKMYCLEGNYRQALRHFKEAIRMTQHQPGGDVFFQHYTQCVMETLELSGANDEVISYCEKFLDFLEEKEEQTAMARAYRNVILEKMAIQYVIKNEKEEALDLLKQINTKEVNLPVAKELLNWVSRGYTVSPKQLKDLLKKHLYYIIRSEKINPAIAMELPEAIAPF
jgi:tetratricopeptide (TPR) repeat protein